VTGMSANAIRLTRLLLILAVLALWEFYARAFATSSLTAAPSQVLEQLWPKVLGEPRVRLAVAVTLIELAIAFAMSVVFGMLIGVLIGLTDIGRRSFYPVVLLLYGIPQAILLPLFVLVFGLGPASKIAFGFTHGVFPILVNTIAGMRNVNPLLVRGAQAMGATRVELMRYVVFPHMVTAVFTGLRLAMTMTLLGVLLAELFVSQGGIGFFTLLYAETFNPAALIALILTLAFLAIMLNETVRMVEARFSRWKE
jgi:NitT/TauT family transport system permease protein